MPKVREARHLKYEPGLSHRQTAAALRNGYSTVGADVRWAQAAGCRFDPESVDSDDHPGKTPVGRSDGSVCVMILGFPTPATT